MDAPGKGVQMRPALGHIGWLVILPSFTRQGLISAKHQPSRITGRNLHGLGPGQQHGDSSGWLAGASRRLVHFPLINGGRAGLNRDTRRFEHIATRCATGRQHQRHVS